MDNKRNIIVETASEIVKKFETKEISDLTTYEDKEKFESEINTKFLAIYLDLSKLSEGEKRDSLREKIVSVRKDIRECLKVFDEESFKKAKDIVKDFDKEVDTRIKEIENPAKNNIEEYNTNLESYNDLLKKHRQLEQNYKKREIKYEMYLGSYHALIDHYEKLLTEYKKLNDSTLERPPALKAIPKSVEDLLLKDMEKEVADYDRLYEFYEGDIIKAHEEAKDKYAAGEISREDYEIEATTCANAEGIITKEYERLQKLIIEYNKIFSIPAGDYNLATQDELNKFYNEIGTYNDSLAEYEKDIKRLEDLKQKLAEGSIEESEYKTQEKLVMGTMEKLQGIQKNLQAKRKKYYNNTTLSMLKKRKGQFENKLNDPSLKPEEKAAVEKELQGIVKKIKEINEFKAKLVIKKVKKPPTNDEQKPTPKSEQNSASKPKSVEASDRIFTVPEPTKNVYFDTKDEEILKVEKITPGQWIKQHKKEILIVLGLAALTAAVTVSIVHLLPAIIAAQKAAQTAGLLSQMMLNGQAWHAAIASEQIALHGANTALAGQVTSLTGMANVFNASTGAWTIGGKALATAAAEATATATKAAALVSALQGVTLGTSLGGLGLIGTGVVLKNRSPEYKEIYSDIKSLYNNPGLEIDINKIRSKIDKAKIEKTEKIVLNKKLKNKLRKIDVKVYFNPKDVKDTEEKGQTR